MTPHTPGPWWPHPKHAGLIFSQDQAVAQCCMPNLEANAALIAAAPALLAAVMSAVEWGEPMRDAPRDSRPEWFDLARAALAKATGSTP